MRGPPSIRVPETDGPHSGPYKSQQDTTRLADTNDRGEPAMDFREKSDATAVETPDTAGQGPSFWPNADT